MNAQERRGWLALVMLFLALLLWLLFGGSVGAAEIDQRATGVLNIGPVSLRLPLSSRSSRVPPAESGPEGLEQVTLRVRRRPPLLAHNQPNSEGESPQSYAGGGVLSTNVRGMASASDLSAGSTPARQQPSYFTRSESVAVIPARQREDNLEGGGGQRSRLPRHHCRVAWRCGAKGKVKRGDRMDCATATDWAAKWNRKLYPDCRHWVDTYKPMPRHQKIAVAGAVGCSLADAATSWGGREATPLYRSGDGNFGAKGLAIKIGFTAVLPLAAWGFNRYTPEGRFKRWFQRGLSVGLAVIGARNCGQAAENIEVRR